MPHSGHCGQTSQQLSWQGCWEHCCQGICINIFDSTYVTGEGNMQSVFLDVKLRL
jgi:hypothetical protein